MDKKILPLIGAAVTIAGLFLPAASSPLRGDMSLLLPPSGIAWEGLVVLGCALLAAILALVGLTRHAVWPGIAALGFLAYKYIDAQTRFDRLRGLSREYAEAAELIDRITPQINLLGWGVMALGALIMVAAGAMAWRGGSVGAAPPAA